MPKISLENEKETKAFSFSTLFSSYPPAPSSSSFVPRNAENDYITFLSYLQQAPEVERWTKKQKTRNIPKFLLTFRRLCLYSFVICVMEEYDGSALGGGDRKKGLHDSGAKQITGNKTIDLTLSIVSKVSRFIILSFVMKTVMTGIKGGIEGKGIITTWQEMLPPFITSFCRKNFCFNIVTLVT